MGRKKTQEEFVKEVYGLVGNEYIVLENYDTNNIEIKIKHNKKECGHIFKMKPRNFVNKGRRCPKCFKDSIICKENFKNKIHEKYGDEYIILDEYQGQKVKIKFKHNVKNCGMVFYKTPEKFWYRNQICPCVQKENKKLINKKCFTEKLFNEVGNEYTLVGEYEDANSNVTIKHNISECGREFKVVARSIFRRDQRCPFCNKSNSKGEEKILAFLMDNDILYQSQFRFKDCLFIGELKYDFAVFDSSNELLFLIEYDGEQHFEPVDFAGKGEEWAKENFENIRIRDQIKNKYCIDNNIKLFRIPYTQYENLDVILNNLILNKNKEVDMTSFLVN